MVSTIPPKNARLFKFNVSFGRNLSFYANGRPFTIPIKWKKGFDRQEPALTGITIPGKWAVLNKPKPKISTKIEIPKPKTRVKRNIGIKINYYYLIPIIAIPVIYVIKKYFIF